MPRSHFESGTRTVALMHLHALYFSFTNIRSSPVETHISKGTFSLAHTILAFAFQLGTLYEPLQCRSW